MQLANNPRVAVVHDWLVTFGGAEKVLMDILECFPSADLFCIVDFLPGDVKNKFGNKTQTTFIQKLPFARKLYWYYSPLMPLAVEQLDLAEYDLIISSSHCFAKGVIVHPHQLHICYMHSPARFIWDLQFDYFRNFSFSTGLKRVLASVVFHWLRAWDSRSSNGIDVIIGNSSFIRNRILKCYRRNSLLLYPGIDTEKFIPSTETREEFYLAGSFMNPFKRLDLIVEAFTKTPERKLNVFGTGPQEKYLKKIAGKNITFYGRVSDSELVSLLQKAKAYVFAATEDFGMIMAEAQAAGTPVIAYKKGGAAEIVVDLNEYELFPTGVLFSEPTTESIIQAIDKFEFNSEKFLPENCRNNAFRFSRKQFKLKFTEIVSQKWKQWTSEKLTNSNDGQLVRI